MTAPVPQITRIKPINPRNDYLARQQILYYESAINQWLPWQGRTDVGVRFSSDPDGYTALGYPDTLFGPYPMYESGDPGVYYADIPADDFTDILLGLGDGETIYQVVEANYGTANYGLSTVQPLLITDPRAPLPGSP